MGRTVRNLLLALVSFALAVVVAELGLQAIGPSSRGYFVLVPGTEWTTIDAPNIVRGVTGVSRYVVSKDGIRGPDFGADSAEFRILAVGGSTTECLILDENEVWTSILASSLGRTTDGRSVWVGNIGRSGHTTREHVVQLAHLLDQYPRIDVVVALVGVNDMQSALQRGWSYERPTPVTTPEGELGTLDRAFTIRPVRFWHRPDTVTWYRSTALWQLARRAKMGLRARRTQRLGDVVANYGSLGAQRRKRAQIDSMPPLDTPLAEFVFNLNAMADITAAHHARLVLVTQPAIWRDSLTDAESATLWLGWLGDEWATATAHYSFAVLRRAMDAYNVALLDVCRQRAIECVDAQAAIPRDTLMFYDDVHFTEAGSAQLATIIGGHFGTRPPFR
jgi:lysophospholipase L1-like esterase